MRERADMPPLTVIVVLGACKLALTFFVLPRLPTP
jgi:hypothetical protein